MTVQKYNINTEYGIFTICPCYQSIIIGKYFIYYEQEHQNFNVNVEALSQQVLLLSSSKLYLDSLFTIFQEFMDFLFYFGPWFMRILVEGGNPSGAGNFINHVYISEKVSLAWRNLYYFNAKSISLNLFYWSKQETHFFCL